ncbi:MAG: serine/threonine protein kinase, partial [Sandaracinaceae bacterium]|nr:serine/threonine protein kinase [Sandaracinaceae bacterium]
MIGQGGMGAVWRARHALTGRKLAVKTLEQGYLANQAVVQRFGREARAASAVHHPGIVEVLDLDQTEEGVPFLVMEFLEGESLASRIERRGRLGQEELLRLGTMLLEALDAAHSHGVVHRDLKPENVYVVPAGRRGEAIKILDFGISHKADEATAHKLTVTGSVLGTPHYMSPEQAMGEEIDHRADLYAAGVVLYECAVGDVPFDAPNYNKLLRTILDSPPVPPRQRGAEISEGVERVILWALEKERDARVSSAREMLRWLRAAAEGGEVPYHPRSAPAPTRAGDDEDAAEIE